jgi:hypothetical protein
MQMEANRRIGRSNRWPRMVGDQGLLGCRLRARLPEHLVGTAGHGLEVALATKVRARWVERLLPAFAEGMAAYGRDR